jgi:L-histidine Nalpha-methyltransferase
VIHVAIHPSQFPDQVRADLLKSLRARAIQHKFHYESYKQAQKWLAVHEAHSPARNDSGCAAVYDEAFRWAAGKFQRADVCVIGLGCGGGHKDAALLGCLKTAGIRPVYSAVDVSLSLVIMARLRAAGFAESTTGLVCDLEMADGIQDQLCGCRAAQRVLTFFGMIPNSEPDVILPRLRKLLRRGDVLLMSANLAPGADYAAGVKRVLPQYDNAQTADWLLTFLYDVGVEPGDGKIDFSIEQGAADLLRIWADFEFQRARTVKLGDETVQFAAGERVRLFYSYRYTPERLKSVLAKFDFTISEQWITPSEEEGVFAVQA